MSAVEYTTEGRSSDSSSFNSAFGYNMVSTGSTGATSFEDIPIDTTMPGASKIRKQEAAQEDKVEETKLRANDGKLLFTEVEDCKQPEDHKGQERAGSMEFEVNKDQVDSGENKDRVGPDGEDLVVKDFDNDILKTHALDRIDKGVLTGSMWSYRYDSLGEYAVGFARERMSEATNLLAYVDNLEMKVTHLQYQIKQRDALQGVDGLTTQNIGECKCFSCKTKRMKGPGGTSHAKGKEGKEEKEAKEESDTIPLETKPEWKMELHCERRKKNRYGDPEYEEDTGNPGKNNGNYLTGGYIMRRIRDFDMDGTHTGTRLEINSPLLIEALKAAIPSYPSNEFPAISGDVFAIEEPYMMLFHNRQRLLDFLDKCEGEQKSHLEFLLDVMKKEQPQVSQTLDEMSTQPLSTISFHSLWLLYKPGTVVYHREGKHWLAFRVQYLYGFQRQRNNLWSPLSLALAALVFGVSGKFLVPDYQASDVRDTGSSFPIQDLEYIPTGYLPGEDEIKKALIARGMKYWAFHEKPAFMEYDGDVWVKTINNDSVRVVVDVSSSTVPPRSIADPRIDGFIDSKLCNCSDCKRMRIASGQAESRNADPDETHMETRDPKMNPEETLLFCPFMINAFSLVKKNWEPVEIESLREPQFDPNIFDKLIVAQGHKDVVTAMVQSYVNKDLNFSDFVKGKGLGLVILMHGPPGTGKTLTAECVAESQQRPLYTMTCGDLGVNPSDLEGKLREIFERATKWGAVLLLDEADVFLQERDIRQLERNALVSVFLRELEYFDGILFLTTNRPGALDEAFQSRIHITLTLPHLNAKQQIQVWEMFLKEQLHDRKELVATLRWIKKKTENEKLNGRQIRNCVRSALALAARERKQVSTQHLDQVLTISKTFVEYMRQLNDMNADERQQILGIRIKG